MAIVVTGGAGYIGAHVVRVLREQGRDPFVVDDYSTGHPGVNGDVPSATLDLTSADAEASLGELLADLHASAVVHLAAKKRADESLARPLHYYEQNVDATRTVLAAMARAGTPRLVYSSSAAVYGVSSAEPLDEGAPTTPANPYGRTKLIGEWLVRASIRQFPLSAAVLRYFNVAGAGWADLADRQTDNLVTATLARLERHEAPAIYGADYETADGTCVRDFVHVLDVAEAHVAALDLLAAHDAGYYGAFNVGTGGGATVRQVVDRLIALTAVDVAPLTLPRRAGDVPSVIADTGRIAREVGWRARFDLDQTLASAVSAWAAHHPMSPRS